MQRKYESIHLSLPFFACFLSFLFFSRVFLNCLSTRPSFIFVLLSSLAFRQALQKRGYVTQSSCRPQFVLTVSLSPSHLTSHTYFCASISLPLSAVPILSPTFLYTTILKEPSKPFRVTEMYERNCIYCF